jgi:hypothetical protein
VIGWLPSVVIVMATALAITTTQSRFANGSLIVIKHRVESLVKGPASLAELQMVGRELTREARRNGQPSSGPRWQPAQMSLNPETQDVTISIDWEAVVE